ncbi:rhombotarget lipoprotein [Aliagarivorans marinus]|uniref:rhombotarget lipoprotein n=1 Tax=Aliagarivorans marinus TaxID=561965 RepID=UPI00040FC6E1|nr:rhombotarget lipoprotein [Aliagarivorans marinus]
MYKVTPLARRRDCRFLVCCVCLMLVTLLSGCSFLVRHPPESNSVSSSLMSYLYPDENGGHNKTPQTVVLRPPVNVAIAMVPPVNEGHRGMSSELQQTLLEKIRDQFSDREYVGRIEVLTDTYLEGGQGFDRLRQLARMYDVEIFALVSYDQLQQSKENSAAFLYWTIVGMYVVPANSNSINTFVDTAVFDVSGETLLLRAPGTHRAEALSSAVNVEESITKHAALSFDYAVDDMIVNLSDQLGRFETQLKDDAVNTTNKRIVVEHKKGYSGSAGAAGMLAVLLVLLLLIRVYRSRPGANN